MNWDRIGGNWKQFKGNALQQWGKLTDDQLDVIAGKRDVLGRGRPYGMLRDEGMRRLAAVGRSACSNGRPTRPPSGAEIACSTPSRNILVLVWLVGLLSSATLGGFIHVPAGGRGDHRPAQSDYGTDRHAWSRSEKSSLADAAPWPAHRRLR